MTKNNNGYMVLSNNPTWIQLPLGDEETEWDKAKIGWCKENVNPKCYRISDIGFLYSDYVVEFKNEGDAALFILRWGVKSVDHL